MNKDELFMQEALKEARKASKRGDWSIGCVIVCNDKIISKGSNRIYSSNDKFAHAEMIAIKKISQELIDNQGKCNLYTTVEPCPMCFGASLLHHINKIVFGIKDSAGSSHFIEHLPVIFKQKQYQMQIEGGVLADECWEIFLKGKPTGKLIKDKLILEEYK